ncbi:DENN domain-containing protein 3-like isoform X1 [Lingula anatina]|uniref:DENN domain-containing protein 3-like isoform X1 n=1 Tax=Lingula anatina TaxID=7574 RepID=A0A2R2MRB7_LINAN|nr:DENN domain-containing protein 3-like isoform X1 [Lingula anatina]|eukprot:XP_023932557.1 DENN domain-containing protein 3-like isoform X1 [Lingula anatina]
MASRLHNSLIDLLVMVGLDQETGLKPNVTDSSANDPLFLSNYEPQVLASISAQCAMFPQSFPNQDEAYPPTDAVDNRTVLTPISEQEDAHFRACDRRKRIAKSLPRRVTLGTIAGGRKMLRMLSTSGGELPISAEVIQSLTAFCFPDGMKVYRHSMPTHIHFLVLTDITGERSYAACATYTRSFMCKSCRVEEGDDHYYDAIPEDFIEDGSAHKMGQRVYIPCCLTLISKYPYFTVMKECLSCLVPKLQSNPREVKTTLEKFALQLSATPVPPAGNVAIRFYLDTYPVTLYPSDDPNKEVVNMQLNHVFLKFDPDAILTVIRSILTQQRIVFMSSCYAMLTTVMESFLVFVRPFVWNYTYVPLIPEKLLTLLEALGCFIMGCHARHKGLVEQIEGIVAVNIDDGSVDVCSTLNIPQLPFAAEQDFKQAVTQMKPRLNMEMAQVERPCPVNLEQLTHNRDMFQLQINKDIQAVCLELMVNLFREVKKYIREASSFFNKDQFLENQREEELPFYREVVSTELFKAFVRSRFQGADFFDEFEDKMKLATRQHAGPKFQNPDDQVRPGQLKKRTPSYSNLFSSPRPAWSGHTGALTSKTDYIVFQLPRFRFESVAGYHKVLMEELTRREKCCKQANMFPRKAVYLYLRGALQIACDEPIRGLRDFDAICKYNKALFPSKQVGSVIARLTPTQKEILSLQEWYKRSEQLQRIEESKGKRGDDIVIIMEFEKIPEDPIYIQDFSSLVEYMDIASDHDTIQRLFNALTVTCQDNQMYTPLDPGTFTVFYECLKENESTCHEPKIPEGCLGENECILKVSQMIDTRGRFKDVDSGNMEVYGPGRLILTQRRLCFICEGTHRFCDIVRLRDIICLEKSTEGYSIYGKRENSLKIYSKVMDTTQVVFTAILKEERNYWFTLITEMWSGKLMSEEYKDPGLIQQAAKNVILIDAVIKSGQEETVMHHEQLEEAANKLCYFTMLREQQQTDSALDASWKKTSGLLQHRVNPNQRERDSRAVEALLYTPGSRVGDEDEDSTPKLWCAMGNGKVEVYDASTWVLEASNIKAKDRVVCLLAVGESQVWAGSFDSVIYVIDRHSKRANSQLVAHRDQVCDLTISDDGSTVYSASLNGQIVVWDTSTLKELKQLRVDGGIKAITFFRDELWCLKNSGESIAVISVDDGKMKRELTYHDQQHNRPYRFSCFLIAKGDENNTSHNATVWVGHDDVPMITVWDVDNFKERVTCLEVDKSRGFTKLTQVGDNIWAGSKMMRNCKEAYMYIFNSRSFEKQEPLKAHSDTIRSLCTAESRYVISGSGSRDGKVAIWRTSPIRHFSHFEL